MASKSAGGLTDMGLYGGLLGWAADDERLPHSPAELAGRGTEITIRKPELHDERRLLLGGDRVHGEARCREKAVVLKECIKIVSVAATQIPGSERLYTFNVKNKILTEYVTISPKGFQVSGSTLKDVDMEISRCVTLRKPDDFIPTVLNKTIKQIDKAWSGLTTKTRTPAPRINKDTILLRTV